MGEFVDRAEHETAERQYRDTDDGVLENEEIRGVRPEPTVCGEHRDDEDEEERVADPRHAGLERTSQREGHVGDPAPGDQSARRWNVDGDVADLRDESEVDECGGEVDDVDLLAGQ
ncbi:hypothetical protein GXW82_14700 [Streptacidiphilus sp. 4-A2]|nr:hypothetical protein [Streptacidiphilus sp. 4-A2]